MWKSNTAICALLLVAALQMGGSEVSAQSVIPVPLKVEQESGAFCISQETKLYTNLKGKEKRALDDYLITLPVPFKAGINGKKNTRENIIILQKVENTGRRQSTGNIPFNSEGYTLEVTPAHVLIQADTDAGLFYGLQTLLQLAEPTGEAAWKVQATHVEDAPRFSYRGFMLDVSRHFRSKEFVKKQIDVLARYKLNRLHLHLTDGAGWRIEIKKYPRLTDFAAWRPEAVWKKWWFGKDARK